MDFKGFFSNLPLLSQVDLYHFYIEGYTESLKLFSEVRVVLGEDWLSGVPLELQEYFYKVHFPCYFIPIFQNSDCYGFVVKGFSKMTPRFCSNHLLPGCERIKGGELVILVEGFKDAYLPLLSCKGLPVVVIPMLTSIPSKEFLCYLNSMGCSVLFIPDNDVHKQEHSARFFELAGKVGIKSYRYDVLGVEDFGDFFNPVLRDVALEQAKVFRGYVDKLLS